VTNDEVRPKAIQPDQIPALAGVALNEQPVLEVMRDRCRHGDRAELVLGLVGRHDRGG